MAKPLVSDELWAVVEPLLPPEPAQPTGGRPRVASRDVLRGISFVLRTGLPWSWLPQEMGCGAGAPGWRRLRAWQQAGLWHQLPWVLLARLSDADKLAWSRASVESLTVPAPQGGRTPARIRRIAGKRARSVIWWSTPKASRWRSCRAEPTCTLRG